MRARKTWVAKFSATSGNSTADFMSRIGKQPITIPAKVKVDVKGSRVFVEGPKGKLDMEIPRRTSVKVEGTNVSVSRQGDDAEAKAMHGLSRALLNNLVKGGS